MAKLKPGDAGYQPKVVHGTPNQYYVETGPEAAIATKERSAVERNPVGDFSSSTGTADTYDDKYDGATELLDGFSDRELFGDSSEGDLGKAFDREALIDLASEAYASQGDGEFDQGIVENVAHRGMTGLGQPDEVAQDYMKSFDKPFTKMAAATYQSGFTAESDRDLYAAEILGMDDYSSEKDIYREICDQELCDDVPISPGGDVTATDSSSMALYQGLCERLTVLDASIRAGGPVKQ